MDEGVNDPGEVSTVSSYYMTGRVSPIGEKELARYFSKDSKDDCDSQPVIVLMVHPASQS